MFAAKHDAFEVMDIFDVGECRLYIIFVLALIVHLYPFLSEGT